MRKSLYSSEAMLNQQTLQHDKSSHESLLREEVFGFIRSRDRQP
jgi:hypothetical protein